MLEGYAHAVMAKLRLSPLDAASVLVGSCESVVAASWGHSLGVAARASALLAGATGVAWRASRAQERKELLLSGTGKDSDGPDEDAAARPEVAPRVERALRWTLFVLCMLLFVVHVSSPDPAVDDFPASCAA